MSHTVIGVFSYTSEAQEAKEYLVNNGFNSSDIDISTQEGTDTNANEDTGDRVGNFFSNLFSSDDDNVRTKYTDAARRGTVVTVHTRSEAEAQQALTILDNYGAVDVNEWNAEGNNSATQGFASTTTDTTASTSESIPVIKEELQVGKREVETGGVRLRSRIVERPVEESIRLRHEHVSVERTAVNRPATEADFNNFKEGTVEVTEHAEVPVVNKDARVVEEVSLGKNISESEETIRDTVRHTEVDTEKIESTDPLYRNSQDNSSL
ncbi:YsnF/AvaK domain-containing protein [Mucilaginibacter lacusdianchii]|uniref:YsnF/AvaK domain-containing protein n=1 Tax=Mucilaginibacter lacusdianchii TaxID=2684211 RepID=UPI00131C9596|nr:YsnF/AvaK domain-containing protein [Mucilaginibacter sp. JXJ CY 39]